MSVRQYIGARYIPRFSTINGGVWDNSYSYEALEIVKYGNDYYTSKKPVPTGIAISNTEYWVLTGNYNGAIATLDEKITVVENKVNRPRGNRKFIIIGDSYGGGYTPDSEVRQGWFYHFINDNGLTLGVNVFKSVATGVGNSKFSLEDTELHFKNHLKSIVEVALPSYHVDPLDITDIIVLGGTNDYHYTTQQINAGIAQFFEYQKQHLPNAFVKVGVLAGTTNNTYAAHDNFIKVVRAYQDCGKYGGAYITNSEFICANKELLSSDGGHPTVTGYATISKYTSSLIDACSVDVLYTEYNDHILTLTNNWSGGNITANVRLHNEITSLHFNVTGAYISYNFANPETIATPTKLTEYTLGTLNSNLIKGVGTGSVFGLSTIAALNANGGFIPNGLGVFKMVEGTVSVPVAIQIGDTTSRNYSQLFLSPTYTMPTITQCF